VARRAGGGAPAGHAPWSLVPVIHARVCLRRPSLVDLGVSRRPPSPVPRSCLSRSPGGGARPAGSSGGGNNPGSRAAPPTSGGTRRRGPPSPRKVFADRAQLPVRDRQPCRHPGGDASGDLVDVGEVELVEQLHRLGAAVAGVAIDDVARAPVERGDPIGEVGGVEVDVDGPGDALAGSTVSMTAVAPPLQATTARARATTRTRFIR
jgi:hypothetical protein